MKPLALMGGPPEYPDRLAIARPSVPPLARVVKRYEPSYERGVLTNGPLVHELEEVVAARLEVPHVVAVSSCTAGLMLVLSRVGDGGPVALPSFTFSASAHSVAWNGRETVFVECLPEAFQVDPSAAAAAGAGTILATHVFGAPADVDRLEQIANVDLVFDAAHAFGARAGDPAIGGFGVAEVFSLTPTKPLVAGEGGLVTTHDEGLADEVRIGRDYGNPGDYDTRFVGLNGRLSEFHAALALESLADLDEHLAYRRMLASAYRSDLRDVPGIRCQHVPADDQSTFKDLTIAVDAEFLVDRDVLAHALKAEGIETRKYFDPPVHRQQSHGPVRAALPVTDDLASRVISLPIHGRMAVDDVGRVAAIIAAVHEQADELSALPG